MRNISYLILMIVGLTAHEAAAADPQGELLDRIVAVVNDDVILKSELDSKKRVVIGNLAASNTQLPPESVLEQQILDRLVSEKLQVQYAQRIGMSITDDQLAQALSGMAQRNGITLDKLPATLAAEGINYNDFREQIRTDMLIEQLKRDVVRRSVGVTPREIEEFVEYQQRSGASNQVELGHLFVSVPGEADPYQWESAKRRITEARNKVIAGEKFATVAASYSDGQEALTGGSLGWRTLSQIPSLFVEVAGNMDIGDVSEPIRSGSGWHVIKLLDAKKPEKILAVETHARHILITPTKIATDRKVEQQLKDLRQKIIDGEDFAKLAKAFSQDPGSAAQGGDLGWAPPGSYVPAFEETMNSLKPGEISKPIKSQFGWHIIEVLDRREKDFTETVQQNQAYQAIAARKAEEQYPVWLQQLRDEAYIDIRLGK